MLLECRRIKFCQLLRVGFGSKRHQIVADGVRLSVLPRCLVDDPRFASVNRGSFQESYDLPTFFVLAVRYAVVKDVIDEETVQVSSELGGAVDAFGQV